MKGLIKWLQSFFLSMNFFYLKRWAINLKSNHFLWNVAGMIASESVLLMLMAWCLSTRTSAATNPINTWLRISSVWWVNIWQLKTELNETYLHWSLSQDEWIDTLKPGDPYASVNWIIIGSGHSMLPVWYQAITWSNVNLLSVGSSWNFSGIGIKIGIFQEYPFEMLLGNCHSFSSAIIC